jgi:hypothetical protein
MSKDRAVLFRFLKNEGIYNKFLEYISTPCCWNMQVRDRKFQDWYWRLQQLNGTLKYSKRINPKLLDYAIEYWGLKNIISTLITWDRTKEGFNFWATKCDKFNKILLYENK